MTNAQMASCDRQLGVRDEHWRHGLEVPATLTIEAIAKRLGVEVHEVEARLRVKGTP